MTSKVHSPKNKMKLKQASNHATAGSYRNFHCNILVKLEGHLHQFIPGQIKHIHE